MKVNSVSYRILLIENDATVAEPILDTLTHSSDESFQVEWVRCCSEGIKRLDGIGAILLDLYLPDSGGIDTFDRFFSAAPGIPILVLIDPQHQETARLAVQRGAQDYFFKARLDAHLLPKALRSMIDRASFSEALFEEKERACVMLNSIGDAVVSTNVLGQITSLNAIAEQLTGWTQGEAVGQALEDVCRLIDAGTRDTAQNPMTLTIRDNKAVALGANCALIRRDGVEVPIEDCAAPIHDRRGAVTGAVMVFHDVSAERAMTLKMSYLAQHDSLTDLPNRVLLNDRLNEAITLSARYQRKLAVLILDLDRFRHINDSLGHAVGDGLLQSVTRRLFTCVRSSDTVGRHGADEFVVLLWELRRPEDAGVTAANILEALRKPHQVKQRELHITGSIGIAIYPDDGTEADALMKKAELAMHHAKESGRDNYQFVKSEMNARAVERQLLQDGLHHAIERQELALHYQPKLDLVTREIIGAEALVRWRHPQQGLIPPAQFISIAEDCGLIVPLGRWVLREACRQMRAWQLAGLAPLCIAINVSAVELRTPGFVSGVRGILAETGLEARYLELELPEARLTEGTRLTGDSRSIAEVLKELKELGALLALDDFGTGQSSVSDLNHFPIDTLKIDQSFVRDLTRDEDGIGIVIGLIGMGNCLHMRIVAEGVETREQHEILAAHGCPQGQGYYFSRPVPAEEFGRLLKRDAVGIHLPDLIGFAEKLPRREVFTA
jgi:diguanylate cyclase (GGDEF)-like protein/PAS domain S-box-containing protein